MAKVKVKNFPVRYENKRYMEGDEFNMKTQHVNEKLVDILDAGDEPGTDKTIHEMTKNELLEYAKVNGYSVNHSMKKDEILMSIEGELNGSEQSKPDGDSGAGDTDDGDTHTGDSTDIQGVGFDRFVVDDHQESTESE